MYIHFLSSNLFFFPFRLRFSSFFPFSHLHYSSSVVPHFPSFRVPSLSLHPWPFSSPPYLALPFPSTRCCVACRRGMREHLQLTPPPTPESLHEIPFSFINSWKMKVKFCDISLQTSLLCLPSFSFSSFFSFLLHLMFLLLVCFFYSFLFSFLLLRLLFLLFFVFLFSCFFFFFTFLLFFLRLFPVLLQFMSLLFMFFFYLFLFSILILSFLLLLLLLMFCFCFLFFFTSPLPPPSSPRFFFPWCSFCC